jgi:hypothetical protein
VNLIVGENDISTCIVVVSGYHSKFTETIFADIRFSDSQTEHIYLSNNELRLKVYESFSEIRWVSQSVKQPFHSTSQLFALTASWPRQYWQM